MDDDDDDDNQTVRTNMGLDEACKYLGIGEGEGIDNNQMKDTLVKEYYHWFQQILKTELKSKNKITAINTLAVQFLVYSFGIVSWLRQEIGKINQKTRKLLTIEASHHLKADVSCLHIKRQNGGCGLVKMDSTYIAGIVHLSKYTKQGTDSPARLCWYCSSQQVHQARHRQSRQIMLVLFISASTSSKAQILSPD